MSGWQFSRKIMLIGLHELQIFQKCPSVKGVDFPLPDEWNIAYVIHTSGSTGAPKTVRVPHSCILPNILDLRENFNIQQNDVIFMASPFTFDPSIVDLFLALSTGAKLIQVEPSIKAMPLKLAEIIRDEGVTFIQATPSFFQQFGHLSKTHLLYPSTPLRTVVLGGEPFPTPMALEKFRASGNCTAFYNIYGITEASCWATLSKIEPNDLPADLGHPLSETDLRIINENEEEITAENGGEGFLMLGGRRVCLIDEETPHSIMKPMFRATGDRVEFLNGKLYYRGRTDETVKRMGKRLNLHSVELLALASGFVQQCCAFLDSNQLLILVCTGIFAVDHLSHYFQENALAIEQPDEIRILDTFPVSKHGKIDRKKLLQLVQNLLVPEKTLDWETCLAKEWMFVTGKTAIDESNFILSGGNSLSAIRLSNKVQEHVARPLPLLIDILLNKSWKHVVAHIREEIRRNTDVESLPDRPIIRIFHRGKQAAQFPNHIDHTSEKASFELKQIWKFSLKKCIDASPLVVQRKEIDAVFVGSHSHRFSAVRLDDGQEIWTTTLPERIESSATCDMDGSNIFVGCYDGHLYCLDSQTGRVSWRFKTGDAIKSSPVCTGFSVIFGSHDRILYCLSVAQGELIWKKTISSGSLFASPAWDGNNRILAASLDGTCSVLSVATGQLLWSIKLATPVFSTPAWCFKQERCLFASVDGYMNCCTADTGEIVWRFQAAGPIFSTPTITEQRIIFGSHDSFLYCLHEESGLQLWRVGFTSSIYSSPFAASVIICSDTNGYLKVLEFSTGCLLAQSRLDGQVFSSPIMVDQLVIVGCRDDNLYCFKLGNNLL
ncbi:beta-alanine-activating enzyme-like isoform X2 [Daphnia carinata]|nr:beta-alanine-activating enzyme-like isoform X2 [Daphnia carinata]